MVSVLLVTALAVAPATAHGACERPLLDRVEKMLSRADVPLELHGRIGLKGLHDACGPSLPPHVDRALDALGSRNRNPAEEASLLADALLKDTRFFEDACPDFPQIFAALSPLEAGKKARALYQRCHHENLGLMSIDEAAAVDARAGAVALLSPPLFVWLKGHGLARGEARNLIRALCGLR